MAADSPFWTRIAGPLGHTSGVSRKGPAILRIIAAVLITSFFLPGCAYLSKNGRQQMAYQRYVKKCRKVRDRQKTKITKGQRKIPPYKESEWQVTTGVVSSPESVSSGE
jgi:hypothetical protein